MTPVADLSDPALWQDERAMHEAFARLRENDPISWQYEDESRTSGYWTVVRHRDVATVSTDPTRFSSASGTSLRTLPKEINELIGSMLNTDDPRHSHLRRIVTHAFAARNVRAINDRITALANELVSAFRAQGGGDLVSAIAAPLPLRVICDLMGISPEHRDQIAHDSETLGISREPGAMLAAAQRLHDTAARLAAARRTDPGDDLLSALIQANVDGESLTPTEIGSFFLLLVSAGSQTTRHTIAGGVAALHEHPDQHDLWRRDPTAVTPAAIDELIRWVTPVRHFRRTATRDTELEHVLIAEGDKVVVWYTSANRDGTVFEHPARLDLTRSPNPHLGFGIGPHYCLGATLARHELTAVFTALLDHLAALTVTHSERTTSRFVSGYRAIHCLL